MSAEDHKKAVGAAAMAYVKAGMKVGLGTGTTAVWFVRAVAASGLKLTLASTSQQTTTLAESLGLIVRDINDIGTLDLVVDGADEVGPGLSLIKGGGGALLREKLTWEQARTCVVIADAAKSVPVLGKFPLPIEIEPFAYKGTVNRICDVLAEFDINKVPTLRKRDGGNWISDGGNLILDVACGTIDDPAGLGAALKSVTGVVEHGLFLDLAEVALIGADDGVKTIYP